MRFPATADGRTEETGRQLMAGIVAGKRDTARDASNLWMLKSR